MRTTINVLLTLAVGVLSTTLAAQPTPGHTRFLASIWIEIVPITPGLRIWGLLSITNNENQQVTIISPQ